MLPLRHPLVPPPPHTHNHTANTTATPPSPPHPPHLGQQCIARCDPDVQQHQAVCKVTKVQHVVVDLLVAVQQESVTVQGYEGGGEGRGGGEVQYCVVLAAVVLTAGSSCGVA